MAATSLISWSIQGKTLKLNSAEDVSQFVDQINEISGLQQICLSGNTFGVEACRAIAEALKKQTDIEEVLFADMFTGRLKDEIPLALDAIVEALEDKKKLVKLDLSDNAFGPAGAKPLMRLLTNNRNIQFLLLNNNGLGIEGARLISESLVEAHELNLKHNTPDQLKMIIAGRNRMESPGATHLAKALEAFKGSLCHIQMPQNSIRPEGIVALMESVCKCEKLEFLDLQDNTFTESGSVALANSFANWSNLKVLNVGDCLLGAKGGQAVIKKLTTSCTKIEKLLLFFNEIDKIGASLVPEMLTNKSKLLSLELNGNTFDGEGTEAQSIKDKLLEMGKPDALDELDEMESEDEGESDEESGDEEQDADDLDEIAAKVGKIQI